MRKMLCLFAGLMLIACGGDDKDESAVAASGGGGGVSNAPLIPQQMRGAYVTTDGKSQLAVTATGLSRTGYWKGTLTMDAGRVDGTSYIVDRSEYSGEKVYSSDNKSCRGSVDLQGDTLIVTLTGNDGCGEVLSGVYRRSASSGKAEDSPKKLDEPVADEKAAAAADAPAGDCNAACDNMVSITMGEAMKSMPALPPQMKAQMEAQIAAAKARAKDACMTSCRPETAHCMTQAQTLSDIGECQMNAARGASAAPAVAVVAAAPLEAKAVAVAAAPSDDGDFSPGSRVSCNWKDHGTYYDGRVTRKSGDRLHIKYDDGDEEDTTTSKCRLAGDDGAEEAAEEEEEEEEEADDGSMVRVNMKVKLKRTKSDGSNWDAFGGEPDIAICVESDSGMQCYPDGTSISGILEPECQDEFRCTFRNIPVPEGGFELTVVDVDLASNDTAGSEECGSSGTCKVGRATVKIRRR